MSQPLTFLVTASPPLPTTTTTTPTPTSLTPHPALPSTPSPPSHLPHLTTFPLPTTLPIPHPRPPFPAPSSPRTIVWFRTDLRLHDHPALLHALDRLAGAHHSLVPLYIFDVRNFGPLSSPSTSAISSSSSSSAKFLRTGRYRIRFLLDSVLSLRKSLQERGSDLIIRLGIPEQLIPSLCKSLHIDEVLCHSEVDLSELKVQNAVRQSLETQNVSFVPLWTNTLYHLDDLPYPLTQVPESYTTFRQVLHSRAKIRPSLPPPERIPSLPPRIAPGELPTPADLGLTEEESVKKVAAGELRGGECEALSRLRRFVEALSEGSAPASAVEFGFRIAPWLELGCVSPRLIYWEIERKAGVQACSTTGFELVWRDFNMFIKAKFSQLRLRGDVERCVAAT